MRNEIDVNANKYRPNKQNGKSWVDLQVEAIEELLELKLLRLCEMVPQFVPIYEDKSAAVPFPSLHVVINSILLLIRFVIK